MTERVQLVLPTSGSLPLSSLSTGQDELTSGDNTPKKNNGELTTSTQTPYLGQDIAEAARLQVTSVEDPLIDISDRLPQKIVLENGLTIIADEIPNSKSCFVSVWINTGSMYEDETNNGAAHFVEHILFKGTKNKVGEDIKRSIKNVGGKVNAFTSQEHTCYYAKVLSRDSLRILDLFLDMVFNPKIEGESFELEKSVILKEIKKYKDSPEDHIDCLLYESIWKGHPMARPVVGTSQSVSEMKIEDLLRFLSDFYTPDNVTISVAGKFDLSKIKELAEKYTKDISRRKREVVVPELAFKPGVLIENRKLEQTYLIFATKGVSVDEADRHVLNVIDSALCTGWSKFFDEIREKRGLTYTVDSKTEMDALGGIFGVYAEIPGEDIDTVLEIILKEIETVKQNGLSQEDLDNAKLQLIIDHILDSDQVETVGESNAYQDLYRKRVTPLSKSIRQTQSVTNEDIKRVANELFNPEHFNLVVIGPKKELPRKLASRFKQD